MSAKILLTGDYCPIGRNKLYINKGEYSTLFGDFLGYISSADLAITNLECPLTNSEKGINKTGPNLKASKESIKPLEYAGFKLVTLANNHIMDFGAEGLKSTLKVCKEHHINTVGSGKNLNEARKPFFITIGAKKFAFINIAENEFCSATDNAYGANPLNLITNHYDIKAAKKNADYVIVISHGGREHYQLPTPKLRERFRFFVDSGADVVVGHHTHCYSGYEKYNEKLIFYSLGNFVFDYKKKYQKGTWTQGMGLILDFKSKNIEFQLIPFHQGTVEKPEIQLFNAEERNLFNEHIQKLNCIIKDDVMFKNEYLKYLGSQKNMYQGLMFIQNDYLRALINKGFLPKVFFHSNKHKRLLLNLLKCETHHEIMTDVLDEPLY
ncbi:CapA family protein [Gaetbulibacter aestuarii]|uniref:CapA family protein n=1 Tax=Gaetbulibacter aestuarii TaxID=1502358 RepID=A0ABW7N4C6_9FLAO